MALHQKARVYPGYPKDPETQSRGEPACGGHDRLNDPYRFTSPLSKSAFAWAPAMHASRHADSSSRSISNPPTQGHWVDVNISRQKVTAYIGSTPIKTVWTSTGTRVHPTVVGTFRVWIKLPSTRMRGGSRARGDYYNLPNVPSVMYFYRGFALHGTYWHRNFGHPMSHGCVNLTIADSAWFYKFGFVGMIVRTHY